jgi:hypothetical protein
MPLKITYFLAACLFSMVRKKPQKITYFLQLEKTIKHLIFACEFAQMCWASLHLIWDLSFPIIKIIQDQKGQFPNGCFMEVIIIAS